MGHWLDGLLDPPTGAGGITIEWDGAAMSARGILSFGEQFLCIDDSVGNRTMVSIRHIAADGDVIGSTEDLRLVQMRGAEDGEDVTIFAGRLHWDPSVSAGSAEISLSDTDAGALRVRHQSTTTAVFAASGAIIGDTAGIQKMLGGHRFSLRAMGSGILDTTTKDTIAWIDATGEHTVTLPPASVGRTLLLPFVGDNPPTLARAGTELINGLAADFDMVGDANGGLTIAISDGTNWVARSIGAGGGGATGLVGDVNGDTDANYITQITGNSYPDPGGEVLVNAGILILNEASTSLQFPQAELLVSGETEGAISITHDGTEVLLASSNNPSFGVNFSQTSLRGGVRLQTRSIAANITLDTTTRDAIAWTDTSSLDLDLTLPPATAGRTIFIPFVGFGIPTLKRAGSELINGAAADYPLEGDAIDDYGGGIGIAFSDGTNWIARTIRTVEGGGGVDPARAINTTAPLTGGGDLSADRTIGIDPTGYVAPTRSISTTAPLTGGGTLAANLTLGINSAAYVAPTRSIATTAPLTGGGTLAGDLTLGITTTGFATSTRIISTTAPLTGGGDLSADRTIAVSDATTGAKGVVQLAGNLAGTAALPSVTGLRADTITVWNTAGSNKGAWSNSGLRIGDGTLPTYTLEVLGTAQFGANTAKVYLGGQVGLETTTSAIWMTPGGAFTPSAANYALHYDSTSLRVNAQGSTRVSFRAGNSILGEITGTGLRLSSDGGTPSRRLEVDGASNLAGQVIIGKSDNVASHVLWGGLTVANIKTVTVGTYNIDTTTKDLIYLCDTTGGQVVLVLPTSTAGRMIYIKRTAGSTNNVLITKGAATFIETATFVSCALNTDPASSNIQPYVQLMGDGTNWKIFRHFSCTLATS